MDYWTFLEQLNSAIWLEILYYYLALGKIPTILMKSVQRRCSSPAALACLIVKCLVPLTAKKDAGLKNVTEPRKGGEAGVGCSPGVVTTLSILASAELAL